MNKSVLILALFGALALSACDKKPTIVNVPAAAPAEAVPGPAGPAGPQGNTGNTGEAGKTGDGSTVIVMPPASEPAK